MRQYIKPFAIAAFGSSLLSGCIATSALWDNMPEPSEEAVSVLKDEIIALGVPKTPLAQYPNAMAMVGTTNDYLVMSAEDDNAILQKIFTGLDTQSLHLLGTSESGRYLKQNAIYQDFFLGNTYIDFYASNDIKRKKAAKAALANSEMAASVTIAFLKPANKVGRQEQTKLSELGFQCINDKMRRQDNEASLDTYVEDPTVYTFCYRPTKVALTVVQKTTDNATLPHKFKRPLHINAAYYPSTTVDEAVLMTGTALVTPIALAIDVVTLPFMVVLCSFAWCSGGF